MKTLLLGVLAASLAISPAMALARGSDKGMDHGARASAQGDIQAEGSASVLPWGLVKRLQDGKFLPPGWVDRVEDDQDGEKAPVIAVDQEGNVSWSSTAYNDLVVTGDIHSTIDFSHESNLLNEDIQ